MIEDIRNVLVIIASLLGIYKLGLDIQLLKGKDKKKRPSDKEGRK